MMERKYNKEGSARPGRSKKRKFVGNQFTAEEDCTYASTSAAKLKNTSDFDVQFDPIFSYCIVHFMLFKNLENILNCKVCKSPVQSRKSDIRGLGFKLTVMCKCEVNKSFYSSPWINKSYEINIRFVYVLRLIGVGYSGLRNFCGFMDLTTSFSTNHYYQCIDNIKIAVDAVYRMIINKAGHEEKYKNKEAGNANNQLCVSGDGSWAKRGFSSLLGIVSLIGKYTNKILDVIVKSSFCYQCSKWAGKHHTLEYEAFFNEHEDECQANHDGSAGKMEVDGIKEMFERSEDLHDAKYVGYIGDGDTKTYKALVEMELYGPECPIQKHECILHVKKRMFRRCKEAKKILTSRKKESKKKSKTPIKKKGASEKKAQLTNKLIADLSEYYGLAIRRNPDSVDKMKKEILATYHHKISTDDKPQHFYCPDGKDSWCTWKKAEAVGTLKTFKHPPPLDDDVAEILEPIYRDLTSDDLLQRCLGNNTQNNNECFNSCVWNLVPKHNFVGPKVLELAVHTAACLFNEGHASILKIFDIMGVTVGSAAQQIAKELDHKRVKEAERVSLNSSKESRVARKEARNLLGEQHDEKEGISYAAGIAD